MLGIGAREWGSGLPGFRGLVVLALVISVLITWPLWRVRQSPPMLPLLDLPQVSVGLPIIVASLAALLAPRAGAIAVSLLMIFAMAADQTRMQPEFISLPILLWGTLPSPSARLIARAHLISLWFYAGLHKLLSAEYVADAERRLAAAVPVAVSPGFLAAVALTVPLLEMATAVVAVVPRTRGVAAWSVLVLHLGILIALSPLVEARNAAVWPWNIVLAVSGFALIAPWTTRLSFDFWHTPWAPRLTAILLLLAPLGFYAGVVDAYPAHHLYSSGTAKATVYCPAGCRPEQDINATWHELNVPLPPQPRLFYLVFAETCAPGDVLKIEDPYPPVWRVQNERPLRSCPAGSLPAAHP